MFSKKHAAGLILLALILPLQTVPAESADNSGKEKVHFIIGQHTMSKNVTEGGTYEGHKVLKVRDTLRFIVIEAPREAAEGLARNPNVRYVEEDLVLTDALDYTPDDTYSGTQYAPRITRAFSGWEKSQGSTNAAVCVIDTGFRTTHEDLTGSRYAGGYDFVDNDSTPNDAEGHGTHVTGIAAATINNGKGIAGMGNVKFYHARVGDAGGNIVHSDWIDGIEWCADNTIARTVITMSISRSTASASLEDAVQYAYTTKNKLVLASAGNTGQDVDKSVRYPAKYSEVIAVTSTTSSDVIAAGSSRGAEAEISAPGDGIWSTCFSSNTDYCYKSGTSMSTPAVAGAAALLWSKETSLSNTALRTRLQDTSVDLGTSGRDNLYGYGRLDVHCLMYNIDPCTPIYNDDFADSVAFSSPGFKTQTTTANGIERSEPLPCGSMLATNWFTYTPPYDGTVTVDTFGSGYDTVLAAYTGSSLTSLTQKACNDDTSGAQSQISFAATKSTTYRIQAGGYNGAAGSLRITLGFVATDCGITGDAGNSFSSARSITTPKSCKGVLDSSDTSDWYSFSVALGDTISASMTPPSGSDFDLCLYNPSNTQVACSNSGGSTTESVEELVALTAGDWRVRVNRSSGSGQYNLNVNACLGAGIVCL